MAFSFVERVTICVVLGIALYGFLRVRKTRARNLPPGPPGIPIFGNLFQFPANRPHPKLREWAQEYGEIYHIRLGPQHMIVLNSAEAADELLTYRSRNYGSRPLSYVAHKIVSDSQRLVLMEQTKEFKVSRKAVQSAIGPGPAKRLRVYQDLESRVMLSDLLHHGERSLKMELPKTASGEPAVPEEHWFSLIRRYTTSIVLNITYGQRVHKLQGHPFLYEIYELVGNFVRVSQAGAYLADAFPILRKLPDCMSPWRAEAQEMHEREMRLWSMLFNKKRSAWEASPVPECLVSSYLSKRAEKGEVNAPGRGLTEDGWMRDKLLMYTAATVLEAGSDTTASMIQTFLLFMLKNPHCIEKARNEMDCVVGPDRLPTFDDQPSLPYLVACIKETMRKRPIIPIGIAHMADEDDVYKGYFIPKGTAIVGNIWAIHMDPQRYPNPRQFDPERFYKPGEPTHFGSGNPQDSNRDHYLFGWGRRFCPGYSFAEASLFILAARIIWGFDFTVPNDKSGAPSIPDPEEETAAWSNGFISAPYPFNIGWKARDERRAATIKQEYDNAQSEWMARGMKTDER